MRTWRRKCDRNGWESLRSTTWKCQKASTELARQKSPGLFKSLCKTVCSEVSIWLPAYLAATGALPSGLGGFDICSARQAAKAAAGAEFGINSHPVARPVELCQALLAVQGYSELKLRRVASAPICLMLQVHACRCPCALSLHQS